ncbi:TetR/AcrR family transcriptional regulator [Gordonia hydrophobica]|uniref:TetR/AcrR family transcriptional regulator n=1 Tax=Gordonia hydrophobica TaxID=40516 RepID=A0ABZ2U2I0_9ACTN|nr:TetR/AcrR family transcriptional regulator [Gordonia hydrophobica]MBM7366885.1 AcrR family transcriptional regulator [Gordonia hydrophobica]
MSSGAVTESSIDWRHYDDLPLTPILTASLEAFESNGYHGASIRDIARRVGVSMPSLYYHYGSKEGILSALLEVGMDDLQMHLQGALADAGDDLFTQFCHFVTAVSLHESRRRDLAKLHPESRFLGAEAFAVYVARRNAVGDQFIELIEQGQEAGLFDVADSHFVARGAFAMMQGTPRWFRASGPDTPEAVAAKYLQVIIKMVASTEMAPELLERASALPSQSDSTPAH